MAQVVKVKSDSEENSATLLGEVHEFLGRFVAYPSEHAQIAHALWIIHCHLMDAWDSTPRIAFLSPEPKSGKTRALEVTAPLVPRAVEAVNVSPAYLFRKVGGEDGRPTILFDEVDTVFGPKAKENEELRGLLNAGHRKGAVAGRCVVRGKTVETEEIPAYSAVALAGLGWLPDTLLTRSVIIRMRRRRSDEKVEPWRHRIHARAGEDLGRRISRWAENMLPAITGVYPQMPAGIEDRDADVWEALLSVADAVGNGWPARARAAAVALVTQAQEIEPSLGIRLLTDLRTVFDGHEALPSRAILAALIALEEAPWGDLKGGPINERGLARRLKQYGIKPKNVRVGHGVARGYTRVDLHDAWERYLPSSSDGSATSATSATDTDSPGKNVADVADSILNVADAPGGAVADVATVADCSAFGGGKSPCSSSAVADVADVADLAASAGDDGLGIPDFLRREVSPDRRPALGPSGDSLDDFTP
jgi:Protein of unknown function (DUF3631)